MKSLFTATLLTASLATASATAAEIDVMTQNQYLGADIAPLVEPGLSAGEFNARVLVALRQIAANRTPVRLERLAAEIAARGPDVVGLQEVWEFGCLPFPGVPINGCEDPSIATAFNDHLGGTMEALAGRYYVVAQVTNLNIDSFGTLPGLPVVLENGVPFLLTVRDRDVILARADVLAEPLPVTCQRDSNPDDDGCNYLYVLPLEDLGLNAERGYVAASVLVRGRPYIVVNTHLETRGPLPFFQAAQTSELVAVVGALQGFGVPVIVTGDFNSDPNDPTVLPSPPPPYPQLPMLPNPYVQMTAAGLTDAWLLRPGAVAGLSCCQLADLSNHRSQLYERIDQIWSSFLPLKVKQARVIGDTVDTKTAPPGRGLWPSDHGAVAATLQSSTSVR